MRFLAPEDSGTQWKSVGYGGAISSDGKWLAYESRNLDALKYTYANFRQCDADECRLELECGAGKEITVASGPTSDPRETQVAVFALLLAFNKSAPCASHIFRTRGLNRGAFSLQVAAF